MTRELPSHAGHHCENGQTCCNLPFHDELPSSLEALVVPSHAALISAESVGSRRVARERTLHDGEEEIAAHPGREPKKERIMLRKRLAAMFMSALRHRTGAAFAAPPSLGSGRHRRKAAKLSEAFSVLHAVSQWSINLSEMADKRAKSDLVKDYARDDGDRECGLRTPKLMEHRQEEWDRRRTAGPANRGGQEPARPHQGRNGAARLSPGGCLRQGVHDPRDQHSAKRHSRSGDEQSVGQGSGGQAIPR